MFLLYQICYRTILLIHISQRYAFRISEFPNMAIIYHRYIENSDEN